MKKIFLIILICFFSQIFTSAQNFWVSTNASFGSKVTDIVINSSDEVFASTESDGVYFSSDNGSTWVSINNGLQSTSIFSLAISPTTQTITALDYIRIYRSTDNGLSWASVTLPPYTDAVNLDCNLNGDFFGGTALNGVIRSTDDGLTWHHSNSGLTQYSIYSFAFEDTIMVFASSYNGAVYRSSSKGDSWTPISINVFSDVYSLAAYDGTLYAGTLGSGVFATDYNQINWTAKNNGLLNLGVIKIKINSYGYIYVATFNNGGVYRSLDSGNNWNAINSGLSDLAVSSLAVAPDGFLYCGTESGKIFRSSWTTSVDEDDEVITESFLLNQSYPNPFNPRTTISFSISQSQNVELKVYDILGNEIATLVNEEKPAGSYEVQFTGNGLTSGIYFYQLKARDYTETKKMILLR